jgi:hypothetical protein
MRRKQIFISYRREAADEARALFNDLVAELGHNSVFMGVDGIGAGSDFRSVLHETVTSCEIMLVLIDRNWVARLENPDDHVRLEIQAALKRNIPVVPVLVQGAHMPAPEQLPPDIRDLAYRNGVELSHGRWEADVRKMLTPLGLDASATKRAGGAGADLVEFGVSHPSAIAEFSPFVVRTLAFRQEERARAQAYAAQAFGAEQRLPLGGSRKIRRGSTLEFRMSVDSCHVEPKRQTIQWHGEMTTVSFRVVPDAALRSDRLVGRCEVRTRRASLCSVHFEIPISATTPSRPTLAVGCPLRSVFASYARLDFLRVWPCVRGMKAVGVQVFMDRAILRPGQRWQEEIFRQIELSEKLLLFWSRHARNSGWVEREWRYSLTQKGIDSIQPFPLADPRRVPPPAELGETLQFDDWDLDHEPTLFAFVVRSIINRFRGRLFTPIIGI